MLIKSFAVTVDDFHCRALTVCFVGHQVGCFSAEHQPFDQPEFRAKKKSISALLRINLRMLASLRLVIVLKDCFVDEHNLQLKLKLLD